MTNATRAATLASLTLAEKAALVVGADTWSTTGVARLGVPALVMSDGPHGLRCEAPGPEAFGPGVGQPATCFPPAVALGCSFDPALTERVGVAIADEAIAQGVSVVLGPGINLKRTPLCGRNFEYFSEDPLVAGSLGAGLVRGIQSRGVGASIKHFAANNQETDRLRISADIDARPLHELYLRGFQQVVAEAAPWTVMCSYNRLNGVWASENRWLLTEVLRDQWGFDGVVVSDWGAVRDRVTALVAGLDLQMPGTDGVSAAEVVAAVEAGQLDSAVLDQAVDRLLVLADRVARPADLTDPTGTDDPTAQPAPAPVDLDAHHDLAREAAARSIVLLKNDDLLPLAPETSVAVIGAFAARPRYQGAGSSLITPTRLDAALDQIQRLATGSVTYSPGFSLDGTGDATTLAVEAMAAAEAADVALVFLGLPDSAESEGFDRTSIDLPDDQLALLSAILAVNSRVVVVLSHGAAVALPFRDDVAAIIEGWLLGQGGGAALADVIYGVVNPSGKLTETIPLRLSDTPAYGNFPGEFGHVRYGEGLLIGYRWYDARRLAVAYPFGHGLSYTTFAYGQVSAEVQPDGDVAVHLRLTNTGPVAGREIVQVYVGLPGSKVARPPRELKAFASVDLAPGESRPVDLVVRRADLAYWDVRVDRWVVEAGEYQIGVGASSRDRRGSTSLTIAGDPVLAPLSLDSTLAEILAHPVAGPLVQQELAQLGEGAVADEAGLMMMLSFPIGRLISFPGVAIDRASVEGLITMANAANR